MLTKILVRCFLCFALYACPVPGLSAVVHEAWVHRYSNVVSNSDDRAVKVVRDGRDDIIVLGLTDYRTERDMLTIKYSGADASVLWLQRYNGAVGTQRP
jgi:hypothetical protein